ncbi:MAG: excinuclease ABC subunit A, partial [Alphaproteobacteria bacterium GM7ARS4]|nr:excinuclease ABC subunit A [Alphaproteobacteria bacterium GM7ARS4]
MQDSIRIVNAREHNLKNIHLTLPRNKLIVFTGLSGSGKSTLAFDTLYAEGQRRYIESLSAYARQFLDMMRKPDVDAIEGLSPAIAIEQKTTSHNPRSTVGTVTEIYDYLRLLFARGGTAYSPATGLPIEAQSVRRIIERLYDALHHKKIHILAPIVRSRKGEHKKRLHALMAQGYQRAYIDQKLYALEELLTDTTTLTNVLTKHNNHSIDIVIDRLTVKQEQDSRLADSLETALALADGIVSILDVESNSTTLYSSRFCCPVSGFTIEEIEPRLFSFNSPQGACPACNGLGTRRVFHIDRLIPDPSLSLKQGALKVWHKNTLGKIKEQTLMAYADYKDIPIDTPWNALSDDHKQ